MTASSAATANEISCPLPQTTTPSHTRNIPYSFDINGIDGYIEMTKATGLAAMNAPVCMARAIQRKSRDRKTRRQGETAVPS